MHPLLAHPRRLAVYLLVWVPAAAVLAAWLRAEGLPSPWRAAAAGLGLAWLLAALCLPAWYISRALPLRPQPWPALAAHGLTAVAAGCLWAAGAEAVLGSWRAGLLLVGLSGVLLYSLIVSASYIGMGVAKLRGMAVLAQQAELRALKAQINPHFLYNSLNSISALTASDPARAQEMCVRLGDFLRRTLGLGQQATVALERELELVHDYIAIEKIRFGDRLHYEEKVAAAVRGTLVPPLLLQPLVENAVVHGIAQLLEGGGIRLDAEYTGGGMRLIVRNPFDAEAPAPRRSGLGLANVRARLQASYGGLADLEVQAAEGQFQVRLTLPTEQGAEA